VDFKKRISTLSDKLNLVYAFPLMVIKRSLLLLERTRTVAPTRNIRALVNVYFKNRFPPNLYLISLDESLTRMFEAWNKLTFDEAYSFPEKTWRHQQRTASSHPVKTTPLAEQRQFSPLIRVIQFLNVHPKGLAVSLNALSSWEPVLSKFQAIFSHKTITEKEIRRFSEKVSHYPNQSMLQSFVGRRIHSEKAAGTPFHTPLGAETGLVMVTQGKQPVSMYEYAPAEHVIRAYTQIIKERNKQIVEKEEVISKPKPTSPIDINRLADQIYRLIERKARIERERRG
jgi:hypothetical protein